MRKLLNIVKLLEEIGDENLPLVMMILGTPFDPATVIHYLQEKAEIVESSIGLTTYATLVLLLTREIQGYIMDYEKLLTCELLDSEESLDEKDTTVNVIFALKRVLSRTKNHDLSWAWEDIKL